MKALLSLGFVQSKHDPVLFTYGEKGRVIGAITVHVDDILLTGEKDFVRRVGDELQQKFCMSKSGPLDTFLSIKIDRGSAGQVYLSQTQYIDQIITIHLPPDWKPAHVPCGSFFAELETGHETQPMSKPYAELMGMLQWVANGTRPDIQFAVNRLAQFLARPTKTHWLATIHVLRYLRTTKSLRVCLGSSKQEALHGFSDTDWASTVED